VASATTGDAIQCTVRNDGWSVDLVFEGYTTNCTYAFGFGSTNNSISTTQKMVFTVYSPGFDDTGTSNWTARTVYGTKQVRKAYPNNAANDETRDGTLNYVTNRIALSDYIYYGDSLTLNLAASTYSNNTANAALAVVNNSTNAWPAVVAANAWPAYEMATNSTYPIRVLAFHASAQQGRPVRSIKFIASDTSGTSVTNYVTQMTIRPTVNDAVPFGEYIWDCPVWQLANSNQITVNWIAYPWLGTNFLSTYDGLNSFPSHNWSPTKFWNNVSNNYPEVWANVDWANGNDSTGVATNKNGWYADLPPFKTMNFAADAIRRTNNALYGRNDVSAGRLLLTNGIHWHTNAGGSFGAPTNMWLTITRHPNADRATTTIQKVGTLQDFGLGNLVKYMDVSLDIGDAFGTLRSTKTWIHDCNINGIANNNFSTAITYWWVTGSRIFQLNNFSKPAAGTVPPQVRGNNFDITNGCTIKSPLFVGNLKTNYESTHTLLFLMQSGDEASPSKPTPVNILYNNRIFNITNNTAPFSSYEPDASNSANYRGVVVANNLIEELKITVYDFNLGETSGRTNLSNYLIWNNTWPGVKINAFYAQAAYELTRNQIFLVNNFFDDWNIKADVFASNGSLTQNWSVVFGVGFWGNSMPETYNVGANGSFQNEFAGVYGFNPTLTTTNTYARFVDRKAAGAANGTGLGDYRILSDSPLLNFRSRWVLSHDVAGQYRGGYDAPGAYSTASPRKGDFIGL
jgi:hypothetical protein